MGLRGVAHRVGIALVAALVLTGPLVAPAEPSSAQDGGTAPQTTTTSSTTTTSTTTSTTVPVPTSGPGSATTTTSTSSTTTTTVPGAPPVTARPVDPDQLRRLLESYDEAVAFEAELLAQFELSMSQLQELNGSLVELSNRITEVENELLDAQVAVTEAENRAHLAEVRLEDVEEELRDARELLEDQAIAAYVYGGSSPGSLATLFADSADEMETTRQYAGAVAEHTDEVIERHAELLEEADALRDRAEAARQEAETARDEVEARRDALEDERASHAEAQSDAFLVAIGQAQLVDEVNAQRDAYEARVRSLQGTSDSISTILKERQQDQSLPDETEDIFLPPIRNPVVASPFGPRLHPIYGTVRMHDGVDLDGRMGTPIRAAADGEVVLTEPRGGYGMTTVIDHGNGLATLYAHQSSFVVDPGDEVEMGDVIGLVGSTGLSTGPHLHLEVRVFGNPDQPMEYLGSEELLVERARAENEADDDAEGGVGGDGE